MAEADSSSSSSDGEPSPSLASIAENLQRSAIQSARTVQHSTTNHFRAFQNFLPEAVPQYRTYEDAFVNKVKDNCTPLLLNWERPTAPACKLSSVSKLSAIDATKFNAKGSPSKLKFQDFNAIDVPTTFMIEFGFNNGLMIAKENPALSAGLAVSGALLAMRVSLVLTSHWLAFELLMTGKLGLDVTNVIWLGLAPRRFLFRHTLGRFQSEEVRYARTEKNVKDLGLSVDLLKKESVKLLQRTALAEKEMKYGHTELVSAGTQFQQLAKSAYKVETRAADLLDKLRYIPSREALVASMASNLKRQRSSLNKRIMKINELGVPV
ncbi:RGS1-HXK1-interacting protein 1 [Glycine soja]|uniref:RGS1-HXK1-interacting protein 1 n=1 Tax=Glycine soja TaxID=3848 RepID=A0A445K0D0_GLYSO|nr:RGS1-HXK1-interacting protein 1 [Glycine soja]